MAQQTLDMAKVEAFGGQVIGHFNGAALVLMMSVGHKTGLFDAMAKLPAATSVRIAKAAGLQERYVREWLGAMVTGRVVVYDAAKGRYYLPREHAHFLTRDAGPNNMGAWAQMFPEMGLVEDKVAQCFRTGGGVPYSAYPNFQAIQASISGQLHDAALVQTILPLAEGLPKRLKAGIDVADIGCGQGHAINLMAKAYPKSHFTGFDFSKEGVAAARAEAKAWGLKNAKFQAKDVENLGLRGAFDLVTSFDAIHDQAKPASVLKGIAAALRPDGTYLMVDEGGSSKVENNMEFPLAPLLYSVSVLHCMTVSLAQGGDGLGTMWGEEKAREMLVAAGFKNVTVKRLESDIENNYYIARKR